jgi:flagellar hook-associated protein 3 FlgL
LIDASSGAHLWADRFDGAATDVFDLQDRITENVVGAIEPTMLVAEAERVRSREARIETEKRSTSHVQQMLAGADSALGDATEVLQTMRETLLEASRTTASTNDRASYAASLRQAREQLLSIANRPDGSGGFIFGGQGSPLPPVAASGTAYAPLAGARQVGQEMASPVTLDGRENFTAVRTQTGTESIFAQLDGAIAVLENPAAPGPSIMSTVGGVVDSVDRSIDRLGTTRTMVGERMRAVGGRCEEKLYPGLNHADLISTFSPLFRKKAPVLDDATAFLHRELAP